MTEVMQPLFRELQQHVIQYKAGRMAVAAVPGSGKTFTLAHLAAHLVSRMPAKDILKEREVLIVTFSNSAVDTFRKRIAYILQHQRGLLPEVGYRVRTLHGLAHDILRERPALVGLPDDFRIIDETLSLQIIREVVTEHLTAHKDWFHQYLRSNQMIEERELAFIQQRLLPDLAVELCQSFIRYCKDHMMTPGDINALDGSKDYPLIRFNLQVFDDYQRSLAYRAAVDFDDLVVLALRALQENNDFTKRLQNRWLFILEDEAQDSSYLQEHMLRLLSGEKNWVRVGDPNQAINTTFTTADVHYLRDFASQAKVSLVELTQSGRSSRPIADLANALIRWTVLAHPVRELRSTFDLRMIEPTSPGDSQPNPPTSESQIHIHYKAGKSLSPDEELRIVCQSLQRWLPQNPDKTVAVLVPENSRGYKLGQLLRRQSIPFEELLRSTSDVRDVARALHLTLQYLSEPTNSAALGQLFRDVWSVWTGTKHSHADAEQEGTIRQIAESIARCRRVEDFLWPVQSTLWQSALPILKTIEPSRISDLDLFRTRVQSWLMGLPLPIDHLITLISRDLFREPFDQALSYRIGGMLRNSQEMHPDWQLAQFIPELIAITENRRRLGGFETLQLGYAPRPGQVTVATMHAAKGLEWDRVYLLAVNNYSFPSAQETDTYLSEKVFIRDQINLHAEMVGQLEALLHHHPYVEGEATRQARLDYAAERLRLLYVGITRARQELIVLWNNGRYSQNTTMAAAPALPLIAMHEYLSGVLALPPDRPK